MDEYKFVKKYYDKQSHDNNSKILKKYINKTLISILLLMCCLCGTKLNKDFKKFINEKIYNTNISFAKINELYKKYFSKISPIDNIVPVYNDNTDMVFSEKIVYKEKEEYKDGVKLTVNSNYLVPIQESGIVVFMGNKDNYGYTIIIQQVNGIDMWYVGIDNSNLKLYDYVEKGSILGEVTDNEIYLFYQKNGQFIDYKEFI